MRTIEDHFLLIIYGARWKTNDIRGPTKDYIEDNF